MKRSPFAVFDKKKFMQAVAAKDLYTILKLSVELPIEDPLLQMIPWDLENPINVDNLARHSPEKMSILQELFIHQPILYKKTLEEVRTKARSYDFRILREEQERIFSELNESWFNQYNPYLHMHALIIADSTTNETFLNKGKILYQNHKDTCFLSYTLCKKFNIYDFDARLPESDALRLMREYHSNYDAEKFTVIASSIYQNYPRLLQDFIESSIQDILHRSYDFDRYQEAWKIITNLDIIYKDQLFKHLDTFFASCSDHEEHVHLYVYASLCNKEDEKKLQELLLNSDALLWQWPNHIIRDFQQYQPFTQQLLISRTNLDYILDHEAFGLLPPLYLERVKQEIFTIEESVKQWLSDIACSMEPIRHCGKLTALLIEPSTVQEINLFTF